MFSLIIMYPEPVHWQLLRVHLSAHPALVLHRYYAFATNHHSSLVSIHACISQSSCPINNNNNNNNKAINKNKPQQRVPQLSSVHLSTH
jgi:hypothetical protein